MKPPRPLVPGQALHTLAQRLTPRADRIRQLSTRFGLRSRRVFLVWTRWTGEEAGEGHEDIVRRVELLPTPRVTDATQINMRPWNAGSLPEGGLRIDQISAGAYTVDQLLGRRFAEFPPAGPRPRTDAPVTGDNLAPKVDPLGDFFYEVVEDGRGDDPAERERYRPMGRPYRKEDSLYFAVLLEPYSAPLNRDGTSDSGVTVSPDEDIEP